MAILKHRKLVFGTALSSARFYSILTFSPGTNIVYKGERQGSCSAGINPDDKILVYLFEYSFLQGIGHKRESVS
jgi:hypothetical protein